MNILILGHKGMLGHMVEQTLRKGDTFNISTTNIRFPNWEPDMFDEIDIVINCIGAIPQKTKSFDINWQIPMWLDKNTKCRIIHPSTDCEMDDDAYGLSKKKAADYIKGYAKNTKMIQTSIIGPELNSNASLLEWFLSQNGEVFGYTKAMWNGNTTLEWAKWCLDLILNWECYDTLTVLYSNTVSKYELLHLIKDVYGKSDISISKKDLGKDKTLKGTIRTPDIKEQLEELFNL